MTAAGPTVSDDASLWQRLRHGDGRALTELYRDLGGRILRFSERHTGLRSVAEDVLQDVFLALIDDLARGGRLFDPRRGSLRAYLFGVARNAGLKRLRAGARPVDLPVLAVGMRRDEEEQSVRAALARLEPIFREVVLLCDLEGLRYEEAADALEVPVGTIRSRLARARARLALELDPPTEAITKDSHKEAR